MMIMMMMISRSGNSVEEGRKYLGIFSYQS